MPLITLPDGSIKDVEYGATVLQFAATIGKKLASDAIFAFVDGATVGLDFKIVKDCSLQIITAETKEGLDVLRHDAAHILAQSIKELYEKKPGDVKLGVGPVIEDGFYYDVNCAHTISSENLDEIEKKMRQITEKNYQIVRSELDREDAIKLFSDLGEKYKVELINKIPHEEKISVYRQGNFVDLCRGPHSPSTGKLKHFKLLKVSGCYWLGDAKNDSLQRIYGTAWNTKADLEKYLNFLEEAKKRDHRKIGQAMELFHISEEAKGQVFWHMRGWQLYRILQQYIREKLEKNGYIEVKTPMLFDKSLWEKSGHWAKFKENMFTVECEDCQLALKPMNCPGHVQIFKQNIRSYKDLPLRLAEFGHCHRNEPSGGLHGLMRVRGFVQDDAHIFCMPEQIESETAAFCKLLLQVYSELGFGSVDVKFSDRPDSRIGDDLTWDKAELALKKAVDAVGLKYTLNKGEGAFYGPKIEFVLTDAIGRQWQCGTLQVDFMLPERLDAAYIAEDGSKHRPVMLHRAILGTFERFIGILTEHYSGNFPLWLAPVQICVATITDAADEYALFVVQKLKEVGVRAISDLRNKKIDYKVRFHTLQKVPMMWVLGKREVENSLVSVRKIGSNFVHEENLDNAIFNLISIIASKEALKT